MASTTNPRSGGNVVFSDPPFIRDLFNNTRWSWLWLILRLYLGYTWFSSGLGKVGNPAWMQTGQALRGFWANAIQIPETGRAPIAFDWYRSFIQGMLDSGAYTWFAPLVVVGELLIGVALILGAFVGIAAFAGAFMNWNFMMAGTASINPLMFVLTILLIMAWKTAGWLGLDRWLLPAIGTPWQPGATMRRVRGGSAVPVTGTEDDEVVDRDVRRGREDV